MLKKIWISLAVCIILSAVVSSLFRSLTPLAVQYKSDVEQQLSSMIGQPVTIESLETGWYWFEPVLRMKHITIYNNNAKELQVDKFLLGINLFKSLWHWRLQPGVLFVEDLHLDARQGKDGQWHLKGFTSLPSADHALSETKLTELLVWLSRQETFILKNISIRLQWSNGTVIPVSGFNLSVSNKGGRYKLKGTATLLQNLPTSFQLLGDLQVDPWHLNATRGQIYFNAKHVNISQWLSFLPKQYPGFKGGKAGINLWLDIRDGAFSHAQAEVKVKKLGLVMAHQKYHSISSLKANISWQTNPLGWELKTDQLALNLDGNKWPENSLILSHDQTNDSYRLFVKTLPIRDVLASFGSLFKLTGYKLDGLLSDTQIIMSNEEIRYVLTRFDGLNLYVPKLSTLVTHLSGILSWQPEEGKLELDSKHTVVKVKGYPEQEWSSIQGAFDWKELSHGVRLSIEHLLFVQPELTLTGQGVFDNITRDSVENVRARVNFSGKNLEHWLVYLPRKLLKPKLLEWLQNDIKKIKTGAGSIRFEGNTKDFPFDRQEGIFSLAAHATGGELLINSEWMPIRDIDAYIRLNQRNLEFDLVHGVINSIPTQKTHIRIDDIGLNKENLLIHTIVDGSLRKMAGFVVASPLKKKLAAMNMVQFQGNGGLNLRIQVPLYPQNDQVSVAGELRFDHNRLKVNHSLGDFNIDDLTGVLDFDETGITYSALKAQAMGYPVDIHVLTEKKPVPMTSVRITGICTVDSLKKRFQSPLLSLIDGSFHMKAQLQLTDDPNDLDHLVMTSDLQGVAIHLPPPLGKTMDEARASSVDLGFHATKGIRLQTHYADLLGADLLFHKQDAGMVFHSGEIRIGRKDAVNQEQPGLGIVGSLESFDLDVWKKVLERYFGDANTPNSLSQLRIIDVTLGHFSAFNQNLDNLSIKAKPVAGNEWSLTLQQPDLSGDITYNPATYTVNGHISTLRLAKWKATQTSSKIQPLDIPNMNLRIDELWYDAMPLGGLTLKSHSTKNQFSIDYGRIDSNEYQINMEGTWSHQEKIDRTDIEIQMQTKDLAASLERWHITPAVDAGRGEIAVKGGWNRSLFDFSLARFKGSMDLKLKQGIITHLSPETEEKLGLGKLLSILSLQTIPRRLTLDFSDLSHDGFSFDIFKGHFDINRGIMSTQDSYLDGPVAYASMKGDLDLVKHVYDLDLEIAPHITASLPVVATIAGGPVAGLATWVASKVINKGIQKISAYSYKVSGPWDQPVVQQLKIVKQHQVNHL